MYRLKMTHLLYRVVESATLIPLFSVFVNSLWGFIGKIIDDYQ